jgi:hypothetical protein
MMESVNDGLQLIAGVDDEGEVMGIGIQGLGCRISAL